MELGHVVQPGDAVDLERLPTRGKGSKKQLHDELRGLRDELEDLQRRLHAEARSSLLVLLQGMDAAGKDSTIDHVFSHLHPEGVEFHAFKEPTPEEQAHDFLWRYHVRAPSRGNVGLFNRTWYEGVLIERVDRLVPRATWQRRYRQINDFEHLLAESGTRLLKVFLHVSKAEQKARFQQRLDDPQRYWKFNRSDLQRRKQWDDYQEAYAAALRECSTPWAPWLVVPADWKPARDVAVARAAVAALKAIGPRYPKRSDLRGVRIRS